MTRQDSAASDYISSHGSNLPKASALAAAEAPFDLAVLLVAVAVARLAEPEIADLRVVTTEAERLEAAQLELMGPGAEAAASEPATDRKPRVVSHHHPP